VFQNYDILHQLKNLSKVVLKVASEKKNKASWYSSTPKAKNYYHQIFRDLNLLPKYTSLNQ